MLKRLRLMGSSLCRTSSITAMTFVFRHFETFFLCKQCPNISFRSSLWWWLITFSDTGGVLMVVGVAKSSATAAKIRKIFVALRIILFTVICHLGRGMQRTTCWTARCRWFYSRKVMGWCSSYQNNLSHPNGTENANSKFVFHVCSVEIILIKPHEPIRRENKCDDEYAYLSTCERHLDVVFKLSSYFGSLRRNLGVYLGWVSGAIGTLYLSQTFAELNWNKKSFHLP